MTASRDAGEPMRTRSAARSTSRASARSPSRPGLPRPRRGDGCACGPEAAGLACPAAARCARWTGGRCAGGGWAPAGRLGVMYPGVAGRRPGKGKRGRAAVDNSRDIHRGGMTALAEAAGAGGYACRALERDAEQRVGARLTRASRVADQRRRPPAAAPPGPAEHRVGPRVDRGDRPGRVQVVGEPLADRRRAPPSAAGHRCPLADPRSAAAGQRGSPRPAPCAPRPPASGRGGRSASASTSSVHSQSLR